jgi:thiamine kinase-like enzyme
MADGLEAIAGEASGNSAAELRRRLGHLSGAVVTVSQNVECVSLADDVHRLSLEADGRARSFVIKKLESSRALRNELAAKKWLPAVGLADHGPPLLEAFAADARHVWHIYEDMGDAELDENAAEPGELEEAMRLIAKLHRSFTTQPLLAECRLHGMDLSAHLFRTSVADSIRALESLDPTTPTMKKDGRALRDRLLQRLESLQRQQAMRTAQLIEYGGPETLLQGDLWPKNMLVTCTQQRLQVQLIDWDRAGVGPPAYDLSTFLGRLPRKERGWLLDIYRNEIEQVWKLPDTTVLNGIFDTCQHARLANQAIWPALELLSTDAQWALDALRRIESWFDLVETDFFGSAD